MILTGLTIITTSYRYLRAARETQTLCTDGPYAIVRHPLYATWIWFILPGMALLLRLPFLLLGAPLMYLVTRQRLPREEAPIEAEFGEKYVTYRENVGALVPRQRG
jgi:protein-S-isoprenylcysteine O-methyltransferase Ste14